jgi:hypothetical protein
VKADGGNVGGQRLELIEDLAKRLQLLLMKDILLSLTVERNLIGICTYIDGSLDVSD